MRGAKGETEQQKPCREEDHPCWGTKHTAFLQREALGAWMLLSQRAQAATGAHNPKGSSVCSPASCSLRVMLSAQLCSAACSPALLHSTEQSTDRICPALHNGKCHCTQPGPDLSLLWALLPQHCCVTLMLLALCISVQLPFSLLFFADALEIHPKVSLNKADAYQLSPSCFFNYFLKNFW